MKIEAVVEKVFEAFVVHGAPSHPAFDTSAEGEVFLCMSHDVQAKPSKNGEVFGGVSGAHLAWV